MKSKQREKKRRKRLTLREKKEAKMQRPSGGSNYARKRKWLNDNNVDWGWQAPNPKPWKS